MKQWMIAAAVALLTGAAGAYESVSDLVKDFTQKQNEALKQYLEAKPDAADAAEARQRLIMGYRMGGQGELAVPLMMKEYEAFAAKAKEAPLREVYGVVSGIVESYADGGKKEEGRAFLARVRKDFAEATDADQFGKALERIEGMLNKPAKGDAISLKFKALDGRDVDLAAMKDKVVLIDFWATWCGPCRAELPNVKKIYADNHDKGFDIIAISLDREQEALEKFVKEKEMPWPQYFDGKAWETELAAKFGVTGIPATFLVGKDGKLVASDLRGEELGKKVSELLAK